MQKEGIQFMDTAVCGWNVIAPSYVSPELVACITASSFIIRRWGDSKQEDAVSLLSHQPDYFMELPDVRVDLMLAGHLHGSQVTAFGLWAPILPSRYGQRFFIRLGRNLDCQN